MISVIVYIAALMCSHISAFRVASNIRKELMRHITALPLGVTEKYGSGKLRRIVNTSSSATENYLAHRLPDKAGAVATPAGLLFLLVVFDWRLGLLSLIPVVLGFFDHDENDRKKIWSRKWKNIKMHFQICLMSC